MQRRNSKGNLQAQPGQLGLYDFDFGGRNQKESLQVKASVKQSNQKRRGFQVQLVHLMRVPLQRQLQNQTKTLSQINKRCQ